MAYTKIDSEPGYSIETCPSESWPNEGSLEIQNLSFVYYKGRPPILKDINLYVTGKEKLGVVGRTGAGKSSLVARVRCFVCQNPSRTKQADLQQICNRSVLAKTDQLQTNLSSAKSVLHDGKHARHASELNRLYSTSLLSTAHNNINVTRVQSSNTFPPVKFSILRSATLR